MTGWTEKRKPGRPSKAELAARGEIATSVLSSEQAERWRNAYSPVSAQADVDPDKPIPVAEHLPIPQRVLSLPPWVIARLRTECLSASGRFLGVVGDNDWACVTVRSADTTDMVPCACIVAHAYRDPFSTEWWAQTYFAWARYPDGIEAGSEKEAAIFVLYEWVRHWAKQRGVMRLELGRSSDMSVERLTQVLDGGAVPKRVELAP